LILATSTVKAKFMASKKVIFSAAFCVVAVLSLAVGAALAQGALGSYAPMGPSEKVKTGLGQADERAQDERARGRAAETVREPKLPEDGDPLDFPAKKPAALIDLTRRQRDFVARMENDIKGRDLVAAMAFLAAGVLACLTAFVHFFVVGNNFRGEEADGEGPRGLVEGIKGRALNESPGSQVRRGLRQRSLRRRPAGPRQRPRSRLRRMGRRLGRR